QNAGGRAGNHRAVPFATTRQHHHGCSHVGENSWKDSRVGVTMWLARPLGVGNWSDTGVAVAQAFVLAFRPTPVVLGDEAWGDQQRGAGRASPTNAPNAPTRQGAHYRSLCPYRRT